MGKLTDYITKLDESLNNIEKHNIALNPDAFKAFIQNIEDLDFYSKDLETVYNGEIINVDIKVPLDSNKVFYKTKKDYPYNITLCKAANGSIKVFYHSSSEAEICGDDSDYEVLNNFFRYINAENNKKLQED